MLRAFCSFTASANIEHRRALRHFNPMQSSQTGFGGARGAAPQVSPAADICESSRVLKNFGVPTRLADGASVNLARLIRLNGSRSLDQNPNGVLHAPCKSELRVVRENIRGR